MADAGTEPRARSASPEPKRKKQKTGGFKWKEAKKQEGGKATEKEQTTTERSYRERSPKRARSPPREEAKSPQIEDKANGATSTPSVADKFGASYKPRAPAPSSDSNLPSTTDSAAPKEKKHKKKSSSATPSGPMIIVNVNDRLGTKAAIPCLASDSVKAFKAIVAAHIGRQPHEIMLKRQGERPFKDQLSLEDYGVSNGVQLDLELDTGD